MTAFLTLDSISLATPDGRPSPRPDIHRSVLETALSGFDGAVIAVSHDRTFLQAIGVEREIRL
jgi:hypothetical protein